MEHAILYGTRKLKVDIASKRLVGVIRPKRSTALANIDRAIETALRKPVHAPPLLEMLEGKKTALILTVDNTRPSPAPLIHPILDRCERAGVKPTVMLAPGRHRAMTDAELSEHLGPRIMSSCRVLQHDAFDEKRMVTKGKTSRGTRIRVNKAVFEHDLEIGTGIIEPSYLMGWSGGRKLLMPGVAHHESIDNNHFYLTHPDTRIGKLDGNPVSDDAAEVARRLPMHFILYTLSGPRDEVIGVIGGHPVKAHALGCERAARTYRVRPKRASIVISSPGGAPYDCDLVQGKKAVIPAIETVKQNGVIILCASCPDGLGAEKTFINWLLHKTPAEVVRDVRDRKQFNLGAHGANILARPIVERNATVILVTNEKVCAMIRGGYVLPVTRFSEAWRLANMIAGQDADVLLIENARRLILDEAREQQSRAAAG